jgi:hypothetical protein
MTKQEIKTWMLETFPQFSVVSDDETSTLFSGVFERDAANEMWYAVDKKATEAGFRAFSNIHEEEDKHRWRTKQHELRID